MLRDLLNVKYTFFLKMRGLTIIFFFVCFFSGLFHCATVPQTSVMWSGGLVRGERALWFVGVVSSHAGLIAFTVEVEGPWLTSTVPGSIARPHGNTATPSAVGVSGSSCASNYCLMHEHGQK